MSEVGKFTIHLEQENGYEFRVKFDFDKAADIIMDEPPPLGENNGPNAARMLAAATANCLSASLLFCLSKNDAPSNSVHTEVTCTMVRNEKNRIRVGRMDVRITAGNNLVFAIGRHALNEDLGPRIIGAIQVLARPNPVQRAVDTGEIAEDQRPDTGFKRCIGRMAIDEQLEAQYCRSDQEKQAHIQL